ncbi:MAG: glycosyltransferase family 9 protein [Planctomycetaceae bacterium]
MNVDWNSVERVLLVRLRSIGDTVLSTPTFSALRRFLPQAEIDFLLEDWVAPVLSNLEGVDEIITTGKTFSSRLSAVRKLRSKKYDVAINLHGGPTSTFLMRASGAKIRIGYSYYRYANLHTNLLNSPSDFWKTEKTHSAEQQLALVGAFGVPVEDRPDSVLGRDPIAEESISRRIREHSIDSERIALVHPGAAFDTKRWASEKFVTLAKELEVLGLVPVFVGSSSEAELVGGITQSAGSSAIGWSDLSLPEVAALARKSRIFIGNDSGIAHIAAATGTKVAVIFGSSNRHHWRPWTRQPNRLINIELPCQPCPGYRCGEFGHPRCIEEVSVVRVTSAVDDLIKA